MVRRIQDALICRGASNRAADRASVMRRRSIGRRCSDDGLDRQAGGTWSARRGGYTIGQYGMGSLKQLISLSCSITRWSRFRAGCARGDNESSRAEYFRVPGVPSRRADHRARHCLFRCGVPQVMRKPERMAYTNRWQVSQGSAVSRCNYAIAATGSIRLGSLFADVADAPAYRAAGHVIGRVGDEQGLQVRKIGRPLAEPGQPDW